MGNLNISRQQLAAICGNDHDAIRQFETLFGKVNPLDTTIAGLLLQISTAQGDIANIKSGTTKFPGQLIGVQVFSTPGASTYTPTAGTSSVIVEVQGGGGAGGGAPATAAGQYSIGCGGSAGAYSKSRITTGFSGVTITVGAGGSGSAGGAGGAGGASSFGSLISAPGGPGGATSGPAAVPFPCLVGSNPSAVATGGNIINAAGAGSGTSFGLAYCVFGSRGASSVFGSSAPGAGGDGTSRSPSSEALTGGAGKAGIVIVYEYA